jgi:hypothetical protein
MESSELELETIKRKSHPKGKNGKFHVQSGFQTNPVFLYRGLTTIGKSAQN